MTGLNLNTPDLNEDEDSTVGMPKSLSLMGGVMQPDDQAELEDLDLSGGKSPKMLLSHGSMLIALVFVITVGAIFLMKVSQSEIGPDPEAKEVEAQVEQALAKLTSPASRENDGSFRLDQLEGFFRDTNMIVAMFESDMTKRQVPVEFVQKDPFEIYSKPKPVTQQTGANQAATTARRDAVRRLKQLKSELAELELQTVMLGPRPVAVISGEIVQPGQSVGSFKVKRIERMSVLLEYGGRTFRKSLSNQ